MSHLLPNRGKKITAGDKDPVVASFVFCDQKNDPVIGNGTGIPHTAKILYNAQALSTALPNGTKNFLLQGEHPLQVFKRCKDV